jgi:hypothetical protein
MSAGIKSCASQGKYMLSDEEHRRLIQEDEDFYGSEAKRLAALQSIVPTSSDAASTVAWQAEITRVDEVRVITELPSDADDGDEVVRAFVEMPMRDKPEHFPAFMSRSALFRAGRSGNSSTGADVEIPAQGCAIKAIGARLSMRDKAIWEVAIQLAKEHSQDMSQPYFVSLRDFAKRLGDANMGGDALEAIWQGLLRLCSVTIHFTARGASGTGSMLSTAVKKDGKCYIRLNPDFALPALASDIQFRIRSKRRNALSMSLSQWLHDFLSTHTETRDLDVGYLRSLCGYDGPVKNFPAKLRQAMAELANKVPELVASFEIVRSGRNSDGWKLRIVRGNEKPEFSMPKNAAKGKSSASYRSRVIL